jgi:hypothetical protein
MNRYDWYFEQIVSQGEMDQAFDWVGDAISGMASDADYTGIQFGLTAIPTVPLADLNVQIVGPGGGVDKDGERLYSGLALEAVDCSVDEYGAPTAVTAPANDRYVSVFVRHKVDLSVPKIDGNGLEVYTRRLDGYEYIVRQGAQAATGTAVPPALLADALLITDVLLSFGTTQITIAEIENTRREDWVRYNGTTIGTLTYGTSKDAVLAVLAMLDTWGATMPFVPTDTWFDAALPAGSAPPVGDVQAALNAIVYDLAAAALEAVAPGGTGADRIGVHGFDATNHYVQWGMLATVSAQGALEAIATAVDGHIAGGAPAHPASSVTTAVIAGSPEEEAAPSDVQTVLEHVFAHLNARTERSTGETVDGAWKFENGDTPVADRAQQSHNVQFEDNPWAKTFTGGSASPVETFENIASGLRNLGATGWAHMWGSMNNISVGSNVVDLCVVRAATGKTRYLVLIDATSVAGLSFDPNNYADTDFTWDLTTGLPAAGTAPWVPTACCSDGYTVYVMFRDSGGAGAVHYVQAYDPRTGAVKTGWPATGRQLPGTGMGHSLAMCDNIRCVSLTSVGMGANLLATLNSWVKCDVLGTSELVTIVDADDGGIHDSGSGDCPNSAVQNIWPSGALCSDGSVIYFGVWNETTEGGALCTCTVADPDVGSGFASMPANLGGIGSAFPRDALFDGDLVWVSNNYAHASPHTIARLHTYDVANDTISEQNLPANSMGANGAGIGNLAFDGVNVWLEVLLDLDGAGAMNTMALFKIPTTSAHPDGATLVDAEARQLVCYLEGPSETSTMLAADMGRLCFDGDSVWAIRCGRPGGLLAPLMKVRRVPKAGMR